MKKEKIQKSPGSNIEVSEKYKTEQFSTNQFNMGNMFKNTFLLFCLFEFFFFEIKVSYASNRWSLRQYEKITLNDWHSKISSTISVVSHLHCASTCNRMDDSCNMYVMDGNNCHLGKETNDLTFLTETTNTGTVFRVVPKYGM